jgi:O-antigen/teichoic acid export membrane protein
MTTPSPTRTPRFTPTSLLARNATLNLLTEGWIFLVLILATPKLVSFLGETSFGLFSLGWVVIGYLAFLDIGVSRAATKFVSEHLADQDSGSVYKVVRTALLANLALGVLGGLAVVLVSPYLVHSVFKISAGLEHQATLTFYAVGLAVPVLLVHGALRAVLTSYQRFGWINIINGVVTAAQWTAACLLAWTGHGVALVVFSTVVPRILAVAAYALLVFRLLPGLGLLRVANLVGLSKLLRFGSWVSVSQLVSPILVYLDRVMIASFVSLAAVTLYTVPYEAMSRLRIIPSSLVTTLYPAFSERGVERQPAQLQRLYESSVRYLVILVLPVVLFLLVLGPDLLSLWMGRQFAQQSSTILQILALGVLLSCVASVPYNALQALGRPDLTGKFHLLELPVYVALCMILIPRLGIIGAALAQTIRNSMDAALLFWATENYCDCSVRPLWVGALPRILGLNSILGLTLLGIRLSRVTIWGRLGAGVFVAGIYFLVVWMFFVDKNDKPRVTEALRLFKGVQSA